MCLFPPLRFVRSPCVSRSTSLPRPLSTFTTQAWRNLNEQLFDLVAADNTFSIITQIKLRSLRIRWTGKKPQFEKGVVNLVRNSLLCVQREITSPGTLPYVKRDSSQVTIFRRWVIFKGIFDDGFHRNYIEKRNIVRNKIIFQRARSESRY